MIAKNQPTISERFTKHINSLKALNEDGEIKHFAELGRKEQYYVVLSVVEFLAGRGILLGIHEGMELFHKILSESGPDTALQTLIEQLPQEHWATFNDYLTLRSLLRFAAIEYMKTIKSWMLERKRFAIGELVEKLTEQGIQANFSISPRLSQLLDNLIAYTTPPTQTKQEYFIGQLTAGFRAIQTKLARISVLTDIKRMEFDKVYAFSEPVALRALSISDEDFFVNFTLLNANAFLKLNTELSLNVWEHAESKVTDNSLLSCPVKAGSIELIEWIKGNFGLSLSQNEQGGQSLYLVLL